MARHAFAVGIAIAALVVSSPAAQASAPGIVTPEGVKAVTHGNGWVFTDAKGMSLYFFDADEQVPNKSACNGPCAKQWPPVKAADDAKPQEHWTIITREDGSHQWAYDGKPIYAYAQEGGVGTSFGDGEGAQWRLAFQPIPTPAGITLRQTNMGDVLADSKGMTLYTFDLDNGAKASKCQGACLQTWQPMTAPALANSFGDWSVTVRADSTNQWTYKGKPLYRYAKDVNVGETNGDGDGEDWRAAVLEPMAPRPDWITVQPSLVGALLADARGITLYHHGAAGRRGSLANGPAECVSATCMGPEWKAVLADEHAQAVGNWTVITNKDGTRQWAYKGKRLYNSAIDQVPGDFKGVRFGGDHAWTIIMRDGGPIPALN